MRNLLFLIVFAFIITTITSCQKSSANNGPYTCQCTYAFTRGSYYNSDTTVSTTYATSTPMTDAQTYCADEKSNIVATHGVTPNSVTCGLE